MCTRGRTETVRFESRLDNVVPARHLHHFSLYADLRRPSTIPQIFAGSYSSSKEELLDFDMLVDWLLVLKLLWWKGPNTATGPEGQLPLEPLWNYGLSRILIRARRLMAQALLTIRR